MKHLPYIFLPIILIISISCSNRESEIIDLLNTIKSQNETLNTQIAAVKKTADSALVVAAQTNISLTSANKKIDAIQVQLQSIISQITLLNTQLSQTGADVVYIKTKIDELQKKCTELVDILSLEKSTALKTGLIAFYSFDGNANDLSGNNNNGTINGVTLTTDRSNINNSAYYFNGNSNIEIPNSASLNSADITISVWYNSEIKNSTIIAKSNKLNALEFSYKLTHEDEFQGQKGLLYSYGLGNCNSYANAYERWTEKNSIKENTWNHLVFSIDRAGTGYVYVNGIKILTINDGINYVPCNLTNATLRIGGKHWNSDPEFFKGKIDDVGIWNRPLTDKEVAYLYKYAYKP